MQVLSGKLAYN